MKKILFSLGLLSTCFAQAQTEDKKWNIGFYGGVEQYNGDHGQNFYKTNQAGYGFAALSFSRYLSKHFDASLFLTRGEVGTVQKLSSWSTIEDIKASRFLIRMNTASLVLRFNFTGPEAAVRPYLYAGAGLIAVEKRYTVHEKRLDYSLPSFGAGFTFRLSPVISLQLQESFMYSSTDELDHAVRNNMDGYLLHTAGLTFNMGKKKDADLDGVSDKKDQCPGTPVGVMVDENGCPLDKDKDGVADYLDKCPDTFGLSSLSGCPDADKDGIADGDDRCPQMAGTVANNGCPDTDKDGVVDIDDKCADTKAGYKVDATGCPLDNDKDGIVNEEDRCPDAAGVVGLKGCPDTDGDGIADVDDHCPTAKGTVANNGCPEIPKADIQKITLIASKIFFETGSDKLKLESQASLDELVILLNKYPSARLTIEGNTDDVGENDYNMLLSQKRTESVKAYLISKGISESRLTAIGLGETNPVADNKTKAGRAKNRRVELHTSY